MTPESQLTADPRISTYAGRAAILVEISDERQRQIALKAAGRFDWTLADAGPSATDKLAVLAREFGEVAQAVNARTAERHGVDLRAELIQVAAVALAWIEGLDADASCAPFRG